MLKRACSLTQIEERKKEIVDTVNQMFDGMDYQDISMKTISERISIARSSLYCYYNNKEEIMLDVLKQDYLNFLNELINIFSKENMSKENLANEIASAYLKHTPLLKIISNYLVDIETHASIDKLVGFKKLFVDVLAKLKSSIYHQFKDDTNEKVNNLFNSLLMLTHGLYPLIEPNENQKIAMDKVGMSFCHDKYQYCYNCILFLLNAMK